MNIWASIINLDPTNSEFVLIWAGSEVLFALSSEGKSLNNKLV
jgi:hypothetical protein